MSLNDATLVVLLSPWGLWLVWEVFLLIRRGQKGPKPGTISMVARDYRYHLTSVIYLFSGMLTHWLVPWRHATVIGAVAFWVVALGLLVWDVVLWRKPVREWSAGLLIARDAPMWLLAGALAGLVLFPQGA